MAEPRLTLGLPRAAQACRIESQAMIKVSWDDIDRSPRSGTYFVRGANVTVRDKDLDVWSVHPDAVFDTVWYRHPEERAGSHRLVSWKVPVI